MRRTLSRHRFSLLLFRHRFFISLIAANVLLMACTHSNAKQTSGEKKSSTTPTAKVRPVPVEQHQQRRTVEAVGSLFAYDEVIVSSEVEGRVEQVMVDVGDRVSRGQVLARVSPVELELTVE